MSDYVMDNLQHAKRIVADALDGTYPIDHRRLVELWVIFKEMIERRENELAQMEREIQEDIRQLRQ